MSIPALHTPAEAALLTRCTENWLRDKARARVIPYHRPGNKIMFTDDDVEAILRFVARPAEPSPAAGEPKAGSGRKPRGGQSPAQVPLLESRPPRGKVA
jgi:excisionase family DNA binding protein